jgi:hypothetical protein
MDIAAAAEILRNALSTKKNRDETTKRFTTIVRWTDYEQTDQFEDFMRFVTENCADFIGRLPRRSYGSRKSLSKLTHVFSTIIKHGCDDHSDLRKLLADWKCNVSRYGDALEAQVQNDENQGDDDGQGASDRSSVASCDHKHASFVSALDREKQRSRTIIDFVLTYSEHHFDAKVTEYLRLTIERYNQAP